MAALQTGRPAGTDGNADAEPRVHPRTLGWVRSAALAMGGSNQSLFLLGALLLAQGSAAVPLLVVGLLLSLAAMPGWIELLLIFPNRVGGIAAVCGEAFRPYSPVLANLAGTCYWWGWVPTCGLTALLSAAALHTWYLPNVAVVPLAVAILLLFTGLNLMGIRQVSTVAVCFAAVAATLSFLSVLLPIVFGHVDWAEATSYSLRSPFGGTFGGITSAMAGLYLIGFAAPAFEAAGCHVGETVSPGRNIPRAFYASAGMAVLFFVAVPIVWLGVIGPHGLEGDLAHTLGPTFAPLAGAAARAAAVWLIVVNMFHGTLQPLAGAARTLSQLSEDGLLPRFLARRSRRDVPWVATVATAGMSLVFLLLGDPVWIIAAANLTYLIAVSLPSIAVWLLRRHSPELRRPYRAPRGTIILGLVAAGAWGLSAVLGFEQFGLPTVVFGVGLAYSGAALYSVRKYQDRRRIGRRGARGSLHRKLTGAMLAVLTLDSAGYLVAVHYAGDIGSEVNAVLSDIFVAVALITITVGLVLPGLISHAVTQIATAARRLANGTLADLTWAMEGLAAGDLESGRPTLATRYVVVHSADELGDMATSFNTMQDEVTRASTALRGARAQLLSSRTNLEYLAETDPLTGLSNRRHFERELAAEVARTARLRQSAALLVLDLDNFKYMNDSHGHAVGDAVLCRIAATLQECLRSTDVIGRLGGDEFAVVLPGVSIAQAEVIARDLLDAIRATRVELDSGAQARLTVSIGITTFDGDTDIGATELLVNADIAMYDAKAAGRDRLSIATADVHQQRVKSRQRWFELMRTALEDERMVLLAQPILFLATGEITQYELLIRMPGADGELILPSAFLDIAEQSGIIRDIDLWVVRRACAMIAEARAAGRELRLEINVSGVSVSDPEFLRLIEPELAGIQPDAGNLVFELTETAAVYNLKTATDFATRLARYGCTVALDDFGAGFGSYYYLKHLPCRYLKIDGEFIRNLPNSAVDQVFVRSMVELATGLGKLTIAEFVEDEATMCLLRDLGVDYAQGYHVGRPALLPAGAGEATTPLLAAG